MKCERCDKERPHNYVHPMYAYGGYIRVDPECALAIMGEIHGGTFTKFKGAVAQERLKDFREWKEDHGE